MSTVQYCFTSTETIRLVRTDSPGRPPRLSQLLNSEGFALVEFKQIKLKLNKTLNLKVRFYLRAST